MHRALISVAILLLASGAARAQPAQVFLIRHAEKPEEGNGLSLKGRERAAALAPFFLGTDALLEHGPPAAIYAQAQKHKSSSARPIETVKPLAAALGLSINKSFDRDDYASMVREIMTTAKYKNHTVVICWEHKIIPKIAAEFGATTAPQTWEGSVYDRVWIITFHSDQRPSLKDLPQQLLIYDKTK
jgi:hypothetical protein